jgi:N-acyl-D-amino-acid deacylase
VYPRPARVRQTFPQPAPRATVARMHDLAVRGGTLVDGTGAPPRTGDLAIDGDRIVRVGGTAGAARRELDARGLLVTPGWVDIHSHYDAQVAWDPYLTPSSWHGVTTVVMGNCGVGFAPARADRHDWLIGLMEGVEDIPGASIAAGLDWRWETFPEYLDALAAQPRAVDVAAQVPHGAVRAYVMGERGARNAPATDDDRRAMAAIVAEGIAAGALGFSTSRTQLHRAVDGEPVPGTYADAAELLAIGHAMAGGVFELASDLMPEAPELAWMEQLSRETGRPVTFACLQNDLDREQWRRLLDAAEQAATRGARLVPQVAARPTSLLLGLQGAVHPFMGHATYAEIADLPLDARVRRLRDPAMRRRMLAERPAIANPLVAFITASFQKLFPLGDPPEYEPTPEQSVEALARRSRRTPADVAYDLLLEQDGRAFLYFPLLNYAHGDFEAIRTMLEHPRAVFGLADGGAHCGVICDASMPSYLLTHWARDRRRGPRLPLEYLVHRQTRHTAELYGLRDRGLLAPGLRADVNLIDHAALALLAPEMRHDLPAGGRRLVQRARGYRATIKNGHVVFEDGEPTGALPAGLVRGPQRDPRTGATRA